VPSAKSLAKKKKVSRQRVPRTHAGGTWTRARYFSFIRSALRRASSNYPVKYQVLNENRRAKPPKKAGKHRYEHQCNSCRKWVPQKDIDIDHIVPAGSLNSYEDLPGFAERLLPNSAEAYQKLCKKCHQVKTDKERGKK
jgi:cytochrome c5